ncbi:hypothetical protein GLI01_28080 [Gluconacetobacter liquefaciens]|nr:hypothetical protein GLI01_28080 [Gluconacetobacter liquefaciens]
MFGGEPVIGDKHLDADARGNLAGKVGKGSRRAEHIATAMDVKQTRIRACPVWPEPNTRNTANRRVLYPSPRYRRDGAKHRVEHRSRLRAETVPLMR